MTTKRVRMYREYYVNESLTDIQICVFDPNLKEAPIEEITDKFYLFVSVICLRQ